MSRVSAIVMALMFSAAAPAAWAGDVAFQVLTTRNKPASNAVVTAYPDGPARPMPARFGGPNEMAQHDLQFDPFVLIAPVGADVAFPNRDTVRHHVYSFSPAKPFELKLYGKDQTRSVRFDKAGVIALGCNIHDGMVAFIKVVDTPFAVKTDDKGQAVLRGLPPGPVKIRIWHPYLKADGNEIERVVTVPAAGDVAQTVQVDVRNAPDRRGAY